MSRAREINHPDFYAKELVVRAGEKQARTAYLDTNVFDHIDKRIGIGDLEVEGIQEARGNGTLSIPVSDTNFAEATLTLKTSREIGLRQLRLMLDLCDIKRIIKSSNLLLIEDLGAYASGDDPEPPFVQNVAMLAMLEQLRDPTEDDLTAMMEYADIQKGQRTRFLTAYC